MDRFCRICYNSKMWREPTGEASLLETSSYAQKNGYGHEEWLFNYEKLLRPSKGGNDLFKYSYLQPIGKFYNAYVGEYHNLLLYTVGRSKERLAVGVLRNVFVPHHEELDYVRQQASNEGLIDKMLTELAPYIEGAAPDWHKCPSMEVFNVRFNVNDVEIFDPFRELEPTSPVYRINRYHPLKWSIADIPLASQKRLKGVGSDGSDEERSEAVRHKCAVMGLTYSPQHVRLQNTIYRHLKRKYGPTKVFYEKDFVDLTVWTESSTIFYEIKILPTAKSCVRQALGQVLEYCHYPNEDKAQSLIVVGDIAPTEDDKNYLQHIRYIYNIPIYYQRWNRDNEEFDELV